MMEGTIDALVPQTPTSDQTPPTTIQDLRNNPSLWYKIHVFIYDLRHYTEKVDSEHRLGTIIDPSFLGLPYFEPAEVRMLKGTTVNGEQTLADVIQETLDERFNRRKKKQVESGDFRVCAAHDLAPIFEKGLNIKPKDMDRNKEFVTLVETYGLQLKDVLKWKGLSKTNPKKGGR